MKLTEKIARGAIPQNSVSAAVSESSGLLQLVLNPYTHI